MQDTDYRLTELFSFKEIVEEIESRLEIVDNLQLQLSTLSDEHNLAIEKFYSVLNEDSEFIRSGKTLY